MAMFGQTLPKDVVDHVNIMRFEGTPSAMAMKGYKITCATERGENFIVIKGKSPWPTSTYQLDMHYRTPYACARCEEAWNRGMNEFICGSCRGKPMQSPTLCRSLNPCWCIRARGF